MMKTNDSAIVTATAVILLQITLLALKLFNVINWGYEWVLAPIWIPYLFVILLTISIIIFEACIIIGRKIKYGLFGRKKS